MRLSKIAKDFNVGMQTLVEFLEKKGGDPSVKWQPMSNVSDEQYALLAKEFNKDKSVKEASERERQERIQTRDKIKEETRQINAVNNGVAQTQQQPQPKAQPAEEEKPVTTGVKVLGHIDLDALNKKPAAAKPAPKPEPKKEESKKEAPKPAAPKPEPKKEEPKKDEKKK